MGFNSLLASWKSEPSRGGVKSRGPGARTAFIPERRTPHAS